MNVQEQIKEYLASQPEPKRGEMQALHDMAAQYVKAISFDLRHSALICG